MSCCCSHHVEGGTLPKKFSTVAFLSFPPLAAYDRARVAQVGLMQSEITDYSGYMLQQMTSQEHVNEIRSHADEICFPMFSPPAHLGRNFPKGLHKPFIIQLLKQLHGTFEELKDGVDRGRVPTSSSQHLLCHHKRELLIEFNQNNYTTSVTSPNHCLTSQPICLHLSCGSRYSAEVGL